MPKRKETLSQKEYAMLASMAYHPKKKRKSIKNAKYIPKLSSDEIAVFKSHNGKYIASARGTTLGQGAGTAAKDLSTDILVGLGISDIGSRNKDLTSRVKHLKDIFGANNVELTGHSLGGTLATNVAKKLNVKSTTFNEGASPFAVPKHTKKQKSYSVEGDPVSMFDKEAKKVKKKKKKLGAHTIKQFY